MVESFDARWDRQRPFNRYVYSSTVSGRGTSTVTDGYDRAFYGMRRMYHLASVYDFENSNNNKLRFDLEYHNDDLRSDFAPAWYAMGPMKLATSQDKREFIMNRNGRPASNTRARPGAMTICSAPITTS